MTGKDTEKLLQRMTRERERMGLSEYELAQALGVHEQTVEKWERGAVNPHEKSMTRVKQWLADPHPPEEPLVYEGGCQIVDCPNEVDFRYENPHSGSSGRFCADHLEMLNPNVSGDEWLEKGYAKVVRR
ncbi:helix-turn-helix domain-containing protein [Halomarina rubra]|uniref:Helix-turn-helix domain-containing protein n=1 Tax=Halomarina rubra TaxID=2071873 RepID=A0ABD6B1N4_9EURY|nr:helix-turn-helix transcriptional regulator [Halomarina rubra]